MFIASRTRSKVDKAIKEIEEEVGVGGGKGKVDIEFVELDLMSLKSCKKAAEDLKKRTDRLDAVICNAGTSLLGSISLRNRSDI